MAELRLVRKIRTLYFILEYLATQRPNPIRAIHHLIRLRRQIGFRGLKQHLRQFINDRISYLRWVRKYDTLNERDRRAILRHITALPIPLFSIVLEAGDSNEKELAQTVTSIRRQLYPQWELYIASDAPLPPTVCPYIEAWSQEDGRIKTTAPRKGEGGGTTTTINDSLDLAAGEFVLFLESGSQLAEHALYLLAATLEKNPGLDFLYADEDCINEHHHRIQPHFKPDWNPDLLQGWNYIGRPAACRTALARQVGGRRKGFGGNADWDFILRATETLPAERIRHIPHVLYHGKQFPEATIPPAATSESSLRVVAEHLIRQDLPAKAMPCWNGQVRVCYSLPNPAPGVSILIPTRNGLHLLRRCVESLYEKTCYPNFEVIVVDNRSDDPSTLAYLKALSKRPGIRVLRYDAPFNFAALTNFAVNAVHTPLVCLLNNDTEILSSNWLTELAGQASRPEVGAVGGMLYYPNDTIQHAGVILGIGLGHVAGHWHLGIQRGSPGYYGRAALTQELSAVTAACMMLRKSVYAEVGGMDETSLAVAYNDIDLCLRIREKGYRIVWTPHAELYHHESASRGKDLSPEKRARFLRETETMHSRWGALLSRDPAYNPNLTLNAPWPLLAHPPRSEKPWLAF